MPDTSDDHPFGVIEATLKKAVAAFEAASIPFLLGGSLAAWARGGPESRKDLDFMIKPEDAERALDALCGAGMRPERPPEPWLLKAWDDDVMVDLIHHPEGLEITDEVISRGEKVSVFGVEPRVMALEDVMTTKLMALGEHTLDYEGVLQIARSLREQIDWEQVRARTQSSPYAKAFFTMVEELGILPRRAGGDGEAAPDAAVGASGEQRGGEGSAQAPARDPEGRTIRIEAA